MSVEKLVSQKVVPAGSTFDESQLYIVNPSSYYESKFSASPPVLTLSNGGTTIWEHTYARNEAFTVHDMVLQWTSTNTSATEGCKFYNPFALLRSFKMLINNQEVAYFQDVFQILEQVSNHLKKYPEEEVYQMLARLRNETEATFNGEEYPTSGTSYHQLPLFWLVPELKKHLANISGVTKVQFDIAFQSNTNSLLNNQFCQSTTTVNSYDTNLTYSGIEVKILYNKHTDARMLKMPVNPLMVQDRYITKLIPNISWTNLGTDRQTINLYNDFSRTRRCVGLSVFLWDVAGNSAYNSAEACKYKSGPEFIAYEIKSGSDVLVDLKEPTKDLHARKRYALDTWKNRNGCAMPLEILNKTTDLADYYIHNSYFDLSHVIEDDQSKSTSISGKSNFDNDWEIQLICASSLSANVNMYVVLHHVEISQIDKAGTVKKLA
jgi:hypothetical protein